MWTTVSRKQLKGPQPQLVVTGGIYRALRACQAADQVLYNALSFVSLQSTEANTSLDPILQMKKLSRLPKRKQICLEADEAQGSGPFHSPGRGQSNLVQDPTF